MSTYCFIKSKLDGNVIDVQQDAGKAGAPLDAFPQKPSDNDNQLWEFIFDPAGSGYYFIKNKLSGHVIDIQEDSTKPGMPLDAYPQKPAAYDNQLWKFVPDPAKSGYGFLKSRLVANVIDVQGNSTKPGAGLDASPQKPSANDNQLWMAVGGAFPELPAILTWSNLGTGSGSTTSSGSTECSYQLSLTIQKDGTCRFSGFYTNRGDIPIFTAPSQTFGVSIVVFDAHAKGYAFSAGGTVPSAPQPGCTYTWDHTANVKAIADNWDSIATRNFADYGYQNDVGFLAVLEEIFSGIESIVSTVGTVVGDVTTAVSLVA